MKGLPNHKRISTYDMTKHNSTEVQKKQNKHAKLPCFVTTTLLEEEARE